MNAVAELFSNELFQGGTFEGTAIITVVVVISLATLSSLFALKRHSSLSLKNANLSRKETKKIPRKAVCPFSKDSNFIVETAEHLKATPLDMFEDWVKSDSDSGKPLAARWLAAGLSGQDAPGILRAGLRRLRNAHHFIVVEPHRLEEELALKQKALDDPRRHDIVFAAESGSLDAQRETLELFLDYLPRRYPDLYTYNASLRTITVEPLGKTFAISDWWDTRPLELCERIVQEDLILMRPGPAASDKTSESYFMAAAAVVFSFNELNEKLGQPAEIIHAPVPGFEKHVRKSLNLSFSKLKVEQPLWRNNWSIAPSGSLDKPVYGSTSDAKNRTFTDISVEDLKAKFLKVEYQTIRRLPRSNNLLFTVKTMADPISALEKVPIAAECLALSIRGMSSQMRIYKGIEDEATSEAVLAYLDSISK
jgi:hypothetical protein